MIRFQHSAEQAITEFEFLQAQVLAAREGIVHANSSETFLGLGDLHQVSIGALGDTIRIPWETVLGPDVAGQSPIRAAIAVPFQSSDQIQVLVPSLQIISKGGAATLVAYGVDTAGVRSDIDTLLTRLAAVEPIDHRPSSVRVLEEQPDSAAYEQSVSGALQAIASGSLKKVVLARALQIVSEYPLDAAAVMTRMQEREPTCTLYAFPIPHECRVVGASPELLLSKEGTIVESNPLAGTIDLTGDEDPVTLTNSLKDREEHRLVVDQIALGLTPLVTDLTVPETPSLVSLHAVAHLGTRITGDLGTSDASLTALDLLHAIHPTPAIAGVPAATASELIGDLEPFDRGFFGGAFGWVDSSGDGEFVLGIRGVWIQGDSLWLAAGAGIVAGSTPEGERRETFAKLRSILDAAVPSSGNLLTR